MKRLALTVAAILVSSLVLAACGDGDGPQIVEVEKQVLVEKEVIKTVEVEKPVEVIKEVIKTVEVEKQIAVEKVVEVVKEVEKVLPTERLGIGVMTIRTGAGAGFGIPLDTGQEIAADEINARGGIVIGDKRHLIDLDKADSKWEVTTMLSISEQFVNRRKYNHVTTGGSPMIEVMNPISAPAKVMHMSTTWHLEPCESKHTFCTQSTHFETAPYFFETIQELEPQVKSVFYAGVNFTFDISAAHLVRAVAEGMGFEFDSVFIEFPIIDLISIATAIKAKNPDMVLVGALSGDGPALIRSLRVLGYEGLLGATFGSPSLPQLVDAFRGGEEHLLENYYVVEGHSYDSFGGYGDPDMRELISEYQRREPGIEQSAIVAAYYTMFFLLSAIQEAQTVTDTDKIAAVLETIETPNKFLPGDPIMSFGGAGKSDVELNLRQKHIIWNAMALNVFRDGKPETLRIFSAAPKGPVPIVD